MNKKARQVQESNMQTVALVGVIVVALMLPLAVYFDAKLVITMIAGVLLVVAVALWRKRIGQELIIAALFALFITSYETYVYTTQNVFIGRINIFPLFAWSAGLVLLRELYERYTGKYKFVALSWAYLSCLMILEYVGYYFLNIQIAANDSSLFGIGIIHGPLVIHVFYLSAGPLYLAVTDYLEVR